MMIVSKWKCEICGKEFDNFHAQGFEHKIYCPLCFFKEKTNRLEKENEQLKNKIEKATNFVDKYMDEWDFQDEVWKDMNDLLILLKEN